MGARRHLLFLCGQLGVMLVARFFLQWINYFAEEGDPTAGEGAQAAIFSAAAVGAVFLGFRIFDAVTDPVAGTLSDAWVRRGRQRRTLLWFSFFLPSIGLALIFAPTAAMAPGTRWALLCAGMFVFFVGYTLYAIPYWSLCDDYSGGDGDRRRWLSNLLGVGVLLATALGFVVSPLLVERVGFLRAAVIFAVPAAALMCLPYFARPNDLPERTRSPAPEEEPAPLAAFALAFRDRRFMAATFVFAGAQMSFTVMTAAVPFMAVRLLGGTKGDVALLLGPFIASSLAALALVPAAARRWGWRRVTGVACLGLAAVYAGTAALGFGLVGSPMLTAALLFALGGPMAAVMVGLEGEAIAASVREAGGERVSVYFGVYNLVVKGLNGVALAVQGLLATLATTSWGAVGVRAMGLCAGGLLVLGLGVSLLVRPRR